jgi:hypothetical protein
MTRHRSARALVALCTLVVASGFLIPAAVAARPAPDGYTTTPIKAAGLSIAIPDGWLRLDPKSKASAAALQAAADKNPKLAGVVGQFDQLKGTVKYWVIDAGATEFAANMLVLPTPFDTSIVKHPDQVKASLESSLGSSTGPITVTKVKVDGASALRADTTVSVNGLDGTKTTAYAVLYFIPTKKGIIDLDYTSGTPLESNSQLATMIKSIDIT